MKYFTLRGPPKNIMLNGRAGKDRIGMDPNGSSLHASAHDLNHVYNDNEKAHFTEAVPPSQYFYAQPRQKQRPHLAQQFNIAHGFAQQAAILGQGDQTFVAPKSAPLPRKKYPHQTKSHPGHHNGYHGAQHEHMNGHHQVAGQIDNFEYGGIAISHNGTLPSRLKRKSLSANENRQNADSNYKMFSPFQKLLNRQKVRGTSIGSSKDNLSCPEETENDANTQRLDFQHHQYNGVHLQNGLNQNGRSFNATEREVIQHGEYGELREIVRRIEKQEQTQQHLKTVKHHPVLLVQKRHHAVHLPNTQNGFHNMDTTAKSPALGKRLFFDYLPNSVLQR